MLGETKCQQHNAKLGHASPQFNLQVSSYPATQSSSQTSQSTIHFLAGQAVENFNAFSTYILCIAATRSQPAIRTYHSIPTLETKHTTTPNERSSRLTTPPLALDERTPHDTQDRTKHTHTPNMRYPIQILALCAATVSALQLSDFQPFLSAIPISVSDYLPPAVADRIPLQEQQDTTPAQKPEQQLQPHHNLFRRQNEDTCPSSYNNCANIGAPGLCCAPSARCSADAAGHVACCPRGAACTGTIGAIKTGTSTGTGTGSAASTASETGDSGLLVTASTSQGALSTGDSGFVMDGTQTVATPGAGFRGAQPVSDHLRSNYDPLSKAD